MDEPHEVRRNKTQVFYSDGTVGPTEYAKRCMEEWGVERKEDDDGNR